MMSISTICAAAAKAACTACCVALAEAKGFVAEIPDRGCALGQCGGGVDDAGQFRVVDAIASAASRAAAGSSATTNATGSPT